mmetsp:Transcript_9839/g.8390  ORF Transcript_9839/g.8390 Transcript_9839/m.8390 type:complete len:93 (+) Transcript_9839:36-314(+)
METALQGKPSVTSIISGGRRKVHYRYDDKSEMVEEYDMKTHELLVRKWKKHSDFKETEWVYEVGEAPKKEDFLIAASSSNPIFIRKDTEKEF